MPPRATNVLTRPLEVKRIRRPVSRVLSPARRRSDGHSSGPAIAGRFSRPTRTPRTSDGPAQAEARARDPYSVLLQAGLAMPSPSPGPRWALTPPFHPYRPTEAERRFAFCGAIPGVTPGGRYPPPCHRGARTFLPRRQAGESSRPAVWSAAKVGAQAGGVKLGALSRGQPLQRGRGRTRIDPHADRFG